MHKVKWFFFGYLAVIGIIIVFIAVTLHATPPRDPDTMYTTYGATIKTLDPAAINDDASQSIAGEIFECLYNYQYKHTPYALFPELAAAMPTVSDDGKTVTIPLRKGIRFYDPDHTVFPDGVGPEIKARDFIYSWKRVADFNTASPLYTQLFQGRIVGLDAWYDYTQKTPDSKVDWDKPVAGLKALDDHTLRIELTEPFPQLSYNLAYGPTAPVCRKAVEYYGAKFGRHPIGSGAYALSIHDYLPQQRITLRANPTYRGRPDVDGGTLIPAAERMPHISTLEEDYFIEPLPVWFMFQQGLFDVAGIPKDTFKQAIQVQTGELSPEMEKKGIILVKSPVPETAYFGFNMKDPVVGKNKPLRQAISMAYDRQEFIKIYLNGRGEPAIGPIPPDFPTFDPNLVNPYTQFNLNAALEKMKEAERINGGPIPTLQLYINGTSTDDHQEGEFFRSNMAKIGLNFDIQYRDWTRFQEIVDNRQAQMFELGWSADYPDEQDFLQLFYGKNAGPDNSNSCDYINPEFDKLYQEASVMQQTPQREAIYRKMESIVMEDCPWVITVYPIAFGLHYDWLGNTYPMNYGYGMVQYLTLNSALRQKQGQAFKK